MQPTPTRISVINRIIVSKTGDGRFRLEKYLTQIVGDTLRCRKISCFNDLIRLQYDDVNLSDSAIAVWKNATKSNKSSYLAWTSYADILMCAAIFLLSSALLIMLSKPENMGGTKRREKYLLISIQRISTGRRRSGRLGHRLNTFTDQLKTWRYAWIKLKRHNTRSICAEPR